MKQLLVLGGTWFLGRAVVTEALERGWTVTTFTRGLEERAVAYVLATKVNDTVATAHGTSARVDQLVAALPRQAWLRLPAGRGAHGERIYD